MLGRDRDCPSDGELAALADGSLAPRARARVEAMVAESPELQALVDEQRAALAAVARAAVPAPNPLRVRLERSPPARGAQRRRRLIPALAAGAVAAVVAVAVLVTIGSAAPTAAQAASLTVLPATAPAPAGDNGVVLLGLRQSGLRYPYWEDRFGWKAVGTRRDRAFGRNTTTVFYRRAGQRIGYTIVSGSALSTPDSAQTRVYDGVRISVFSVDGRSVATWLRAGHSCVLSGAGVPAGALVSLAAWRAHGAIVY